MSSKKPTKASLVSALKKANIPIPASASIAEMSNRLKYWQGGEGWLVRLLRASSRFENHPVNLLENKRVLYWLPNSDMADRIIASRIVLVVDRTNEPSNDAIIIDVPSDYDSRWGNGSNNNADS